MSPLHIHLALNHLPVIGTFIAFFLLLAGLILKQEPIIKVTMALLVLLSLSGIIVYKTGEPTEESAENLPGVNEQVIETHEEMAEKAIGALIILGIVSLGGLSIYRKNDLPPVYKKSVLLICIITGILLLRTAYLGGQIRHTEIRSSATPTSTENEQEEKHD